MSIYLFGMALRILIVFVWVLAIVAAGALAGLRQRRDGRTPVGARPAVPAARDAAASPSCDCNVQETSGVTASPVVRGRPLHRQVA